MSETFDNPLVDYDTRDGIAWIEMDDPPANTFSYQMMRALDEAILRARFDDDVHVLVLTGAGNRFFSAGANIAMLGSVTHRFKYYFFLHASETLNRLEQTPKLVVAALNGHALGGGFEIALAADLRWAWRPTGAEAPSLLVGLPEVEFGVLPGTGGTGRLARIAGKARALELLLAGRKLAVDEAKEMGLVSEAIEAPTVELFREEVQRRARLFCPPHRAPLAVGNIKRAVHSGLETSLDGALALERELEQQLFETDDAREGFAAWIQKRKPSFGGK